MNVLSLETIKLFLSGQLERLVQERGLVDERGHIFGMQEYPGYQIISCFSGQK